MGFGVGARLHKTFQKFGVSGVRAPKKLSNSKACHVAYSYDNSVFSPFEPMFVTI